MHVNPVSRVIGLECPVVAQGGRGCEGEHRNSVLQMRVPISRLSPCSHASLPQRRLFARPSRNSRQDRGSADRAWLLRARMTGGVLEILSRLAAVICREFFVVRSVCGVDDQCVDFFLAHFCVLSALTPVAGRPIAASVRTKPQFKLRFIPLTRARPSPKAGIKHSLRARGAKATVCRHARRFRATASGAAERWRLPRPN